MAKKTNKEPEKVSSELDPHQIVRFQDGEKYFGYKPSHLRALIDQGEIPPPLELSDTGRALGWLGQQIIDHHKKLRPQQRQKSRKEQVSPV